MVAVQVPLLPNANDAAGENIHRQAAGNRRNHENSRHGDGHDFHHHLLLRIGGGHGGHFGNEVHGEAHHDWQNVIGIARGKVGDPAEPTSVAHFDCEAQSVVQAEPDGHLQEHLEAAAGRIDSFAAVDGHDFFVHFRFARIVQFVFFVAFLDGFDFRADALHLHGGFVAGDAQREQQHINDQGENDDGPAPVGNVFVQPLERVEERVGDEFHPAEIYEAVERRIHVLQFVVIFGADVDP